MWDVATVECLGCYWEASPVRSLAISADDLLLAAGTADAIIALRQADTGAQVAVLHGHAKLVRAVAFSPDGKTIASGGDDRTVRLWHVATGQELVCLKGLPHQINAVAFSRDGTTLAAAIHAGSTRL